MTSESPTPARSVARTDAGEAGVITGAAEAFFFAPPGRRTEGRKWVSEGSFLRPFLGAFLVYIPNQRPLLISKGFFLRRGCVR